MNKPITLVYEEFKQSLANLINNSGLPLFVVENVLQNYLIETRNVAKQQYELDKAEYAKSLKEKEGESKKD